MNLGTSIRTIRKSFNMNQLEFAAKLGVSQTAISNWERGVDKPDIHILFKLGDMTGDKRFVSREMLTGKPKLTAPVELQLIDRPAEEVLAELVAIRHQLEETNKKMSELLTQYKVKSRRNSSNGA